VSPQKTSQVPRANAGNRGDKLCRSPKKSTSSADAEAFAAKLQSRKGGRRSRDKGNRVERAIVKYLQERGFAAERIPLSGAAGGSYIGDLTVPVLGVDRVVEVKARANGFRELYGWLTDRDILIVRADRREPLVILPLKLAAEIAAKAEGLS
jgi:hypothetical protein